MTRYTPERGYGLDLSGPEPVWRGKRQGWNEKAARRAWEKRYSTMRPGAIVVERENTMLFIPRYRIDEYIKRGLIDPAQPAYP